MDSIALAEGLHEQTGELSKVGQPDHDPETISFMSGVLYCGDNLEVLRECVPDESVDLVYLDPPFNSQRTYNIVYKNSQAQTEAFKDHWAWEEAAPTFDGLLSDGATPSRLRQLLCGLKDLLIDDDSDLLAYITMMTPRLVSLHRVLKSSGSLYLHCDQTASHYLKLILDSVFGRSNCRSEIVWKRTFSHGDPKLSFGAVTDTILFYAKGEPGVFLPQYRPFADEYSAKRFSNHDDDGRAWQSVTLRSPSPRPNLHYPYKASNGETYHPHRNGWSCDAARMKQYDRENRLHYPSKKGGQLRLKMYLDESRGVKIQNLWDDIPPVNSQAQERIGYPTQKPLALLTRIIRASSEPGFLVLDPFCGCGTTIEACEQLGRRWIGIDVATKAVEVTEKRFADRGLEPPIVEWFPPDVDAAKELAKRSGLKFEAWVRTKIRAIRRRKKDRGIDGEAYFLDADRNMTHVLVSVKGGKLNPAMVRELRGTVERERAPIGVLVTTREPSKEMLREATHAGYLSVEDKEGQIPRIQIVTVDRLFSNLPPIRAPGVNVTEMPKPVIVERRDKEQLSLRLEPPKPPAKARAKKKATDGEGAASVAASTKRSRGR